MSERPPSPAEEQVVYTVRFPIEWESRIEALQRALERNKPAELLNVSAAAVVRRAFRLGLASLVREYETNRGDRDAR